MPNHKDRIIYIAGFPRSGTTWFSNLLNAHPQTVYRHEIIGRCFEQFGAELFNALKFNSGLTPAQYQKFFKILATADVNSDKPPFFKKSNLPVSNIKIHKIAWLCTRAAPFLSPLYRSLFTPSTNHLRVFVIKETRSVINMDSIIKGINPNHILFLIRHPYGVISSHIKGAKANLMPCITDEDKIEWFKLHSNYQYIQSLGDISHNAKNIGDAEFYAIQWRVYNETLSSMQSLFPNAKFYKYDAFLENPELETKKLMDAVDLTYTKEVSNFVRESTNSNQERNILQKDSGSDFYSVYRSSSFNKSNGWQSVLSQNDLAAIDLHTKELLNRL